LSEFAGENDMEVLCAKAGGRYVSYKLSELMPHTFGF
jgi:cytidine deaminase